MEKYQFSTLQDAQNAVNIINNGEGFPLIGGVTTAYCEVEVIGEEFFVLIDSVTSKYENNWTIVYIEEPIEGDQIDNEVL